MSMAVRAASEDGPVPALDTLASAVILNKNEKKVWNNLPFSKACDFSFIYKYKLTLAVPGNILFKAIAEQPNLTWHN